MYTTLVLISCMAAAMCASAIPINALHQLSNPSLQLMKELSQLSESLRSTSSLAAAHPEVALGPQMADLNLLSGLSDIVKRAVSGLLGGQQSNTPAQPSRNDIFTQPGGTHVNMPRTPAMQPSGAIIPFNPLNLPFNQPRRSIPFNPINLPRTPFPVSKPGRSIPFIPFNLPRTPVIQDRRSIPFNPLTVLSSTGGGGQMGGMLSSRMMFNLMEQLAEGLF